MRLNRFLASACVLSIAAVCQIQFRDFFGWSPDFALASLLVFAFHLGFLELAFLGSIAALILNWKPAPSSEIILLMLLPLAAFGIKRLLPWRAAAGGFGVLTAGLLIFYAIAVPSVFIEHPIFLLGMLASAAVFAGFVFYSFRYVYKTQ